MLDELFMYFGNQSELARRLNISPAAITQWLIDGVPPGRAIEIEKMTGGKFKAVDLVGAKQNGR
jgi:DNA-binding transcriptional regulator YdaS (Cro superfamily)